MGQLEQNSQARRIFSAYGSSSDIAPASPSGATRFCLSAREREGSWAESERKCGATQAPPGSACLQGSGKAPGQRARGSAALLRRHPVLLVCKGAGRLLGREREEVRRYSGATRFCLSAREREGSWAESERKCGATQAPPGSACLQGSGKAPGQRARGSAALLRRHPVLLVCKGAGRLLGREREEVRRYSGATRFCLSAREREGSWAESERKCGATQAPPGSACLQGSGKAPGQRARGSAALLRRHPVLLVCKGAGRLLGREREEVRRYSGATRFCLSAREREGSWAESERKCGATQAPPGSACLQGSGKAPGQRARGSAALLWRGAALGACLRRELRGWLGRAEGGRCGESHPDFVHGVADVATEGAPETGDGATLGQHVQDGLPAHVSRRGGRRKMSAWMAGTDLRAVSVSVATRSFCPLAAKVVRVALI